MISLNTYRATNQLQKPLKGSRMVYPSRKCIKGSKHDMKNPILIILILVALLSSCNNKRHATVSPEKSPASLFRVIVKCGDNTTPTVNIAEYTLINDRNNDHSTEAAAVMQVKRKWPLAMQSLKVADFEAILARDFVFKGTDSWFNRADYIRSRTVPDDWKITHVDYEHVSVQFIDGRVLVTYLNHVHNTHTGSGEIEIEHISWADIYVKEDGHWKLETAHSIEYRVEKL